ncbi:MAG: glycosyltransferase family 2 protein [Fusobacteriaceae bacterium]
MDDKILLSILIPTYNRENYLKKALDKFFEQITDEFKDKIEILVSDNCSVDKTQELLEKFQKISKDKKINFKFSKNNENLGSDGNFLKLINESKGKFCWIFGDDEFLLSSGLEKIMPLLTDEVGLLHLSNKLTDGYERVFSKNETQNFVKEINYMISFITANIFNKKYIDFKVNYEIFKGENLIQELFYFQSILKGNKNIFIYDKIFTTERAGNIGSYKLFETFGKNQNKIFDYFRDKGLDKKTIDFINKKMLRDFLPYYIVNLSDNNKWDDEDIYLEMKNTFSSYKEFYIFCLPLIKLPNILGKIYYLGIRIFNKIIKIVRG